MVSIKKVLFTLEVRKESRISFLDKLIIKDKNNSKTTDRKSINTLIGNPNNVQNKWKMRTLRNLVKRAYNICSTNEY